MSASERIDVERLCGAFEDTYGLPPTHVVRSPGRVNLIGEHIDYCGLSVLPAALARAIWLAFRPNDRGEVQMATTVPEYETARFASRHPISPGPAGAWANYPRAAVNAVSRAGLLGESGAPESGFDAIVETTLPIASGLSSSSALVVATALAALHSASQSGDPDLVLDVASRSRLADVLARGERYVGTAGGGMDQAACLLGAADAAVRVDFDPLRATRIEVPTDWQFIIADSGERAEKSGAAQEAYNARTEETRRAAQWAWSELGEPERFVAGEDRGLRSVRELAGRADVSDLLDSVGAPPVSIRLRHVLSEASRVGEAEAALTARDLNRFGALLLDSHRSLRDDYAVSTRRLDALVAAAVEAGAAGARLTGAGLGGCIVTVCDSASCHRVLAALGDANPFVATFADGAALARV